MVRKALMGALLILALAASPAAAQYGPLVVQPGQVSPGGQVTITGQGCIPFEDITITIAPQGGGAPIVTVQTQADEDGYFSVTVTIPQNAQPGRYIVDSTAACVDPSTLVVTGPRQQVPPPGRPAQPPRPGTVARTGADLDRLGLIGAGLLVVGGGVLLATKRRRHASPAI
jgi:hypothetical protein